MSIASIRRTETPTPAVGICPIRPAVSPLVLSDRLISLAQDADRAGLRDSATRILVLAHSILDDEPPPPAIHTTLPFYAGMPHSI